MTSTFPTPVRRSFVDRHLLAGEQVAFRTRLHWRIYVAPVLASVFVFLPIAVGFLAAERPGWALLGLAATAAAIGGAYLQRRSSEFAVTNRRVLVKVGLLRVRSLELLLTKVESVAVSRGVLDRLVGAGDIVVTGSGGTPETFAGIGNPLEFRRAVQASVGTSS